MEIQPQPQQGPTTAPPLAPLNTHYTQQQQKGRTELFFKSDVFLFLPSSPRGNRHIAKPINILLPEQGA